MEETQEKQKVKKAAAATMLEGARTRGLPSPKSICTLFSTAFEKLSKGEVSNCDEV